MNTFGVLDMDTDKIIFESGEWLEVFDKYLEVMRENMQGYLIPDNIWMVILDNGKIVQYERLTTETHMRLK